MSVIFYFLFHFWLSLSYCDASLCRFNTFFALRRNIRLHISNRFYFHTDFHAFISFPPFAVQQRCCCQRVIEHSPFPFSFHKWIFPEWLEVQIIGGTENVPSSWATKEEMSWHKRLVNIKVCWSCAPGGRHVGSGAKKCVFVHLCRFSFLASDRPLCIIYVCE